MRLLISEVRRVTNLNGPGTVLYRTRAIKLLFTAVVVLVYNEYTSRCKIVTILKSQLFHKCSANFSTF